MTCGTDGTVRVWDYSKTTKSAFVVCKCKFEESLTCISISRKNHLIAIGSENGTVRILEAHNIRRPLLLHKVKLHIGAVKYVKFDQKGKFLATGGADGNVCLLDVTSANFNTIGYMPFPGPIECLSWNLADNIQQLFVAVDHDYGDVFRIVPPERPSTDSLQLKNREVQKSLIKLNWTPLSICIDPRSSGLKKQYFFCLAADKKLKRYGMPERTGDPDLMDDSDIAPPKEEFKGHEKVGKSVQASYDGKWIATGATDGIIFLRNLSSPTSEPIVLKGHNPSKGGVSSLSFSFDSQYPLNLLPNFHLKFNAPDI